MVKSGIRPVCLLIMDGYGIRESSDGNAIKIANSGVIEGLSKKYPSTQLQASGRFVGLPDGQMGNSEVGHLNIGAGRVVYQELTRITKEIEDGDFFNNPELNAAIDSAIKSGKKLHLYGLLSNGGVHSHNTHLYGLLELCKRRGIKEVYVHGFMDGRDVSPTSGVEFVEELEAQMRVIGVGKIASLAGRYYAMDRDNRWERVEAAYDSLTVGSGILATDAAQAMRDSYNSGKTDEFVLPTNIVESGKPIGLIEKGDSIIFFNFRPDRAREITRAFCQEDFTGFERKTGFLAPFYVCFTQYDATFVNFNNVYIAFKPQSLNNTLGEYLAKKGYTQLRIAETEKYAHVTFFFNGGVEKPNENEYRDLINSPKVATYDMQPEMSAPEVTAKVLEEIASDKFDVVILNFANCDMVGHTGVLDAAVQAVKTVEDGIRQIVDAVLAKGGACLITADHGNADQMFADDGTPFTQHTTNPVPFILVSEKYKNAKLREGGVLADLSPTILDVMGEEQPEEMTGKSLIAKQ